MSPRHLSRLSKAYTGMTAQEIGYHPGFDDPSYFSRVFRRSHQLSPNACRRRFAG